MPNLPTAPIVNRVMARLTAFRAASTLADGIKAAASAGGSGTGFLAGISTPTSQVGGFGGITQGIDPVRSFFQARATREYGSSPAPAGISYR